MLKIKSILFLNLNNKYNIKYNYNIMVYSNLINRLNHLIILYLSYLSYLKYLLFPIFILSTNWLAVRFYSTYCAPSGLYGYIMTYITTANPMCVYTIKIIEKTSDIYLTTWSFFSITTVTAIVSSYKNLIKYG